MAVWNPFQSDQILLAGIANGVNPGGAPGDGGGGIGASAGYETVAASQTAQVLGTTGAIGDYLSGLLIIPGTTSPDAVVILDGSTSITVFAGGASSVGSLVSFFVPIGAASVSGAWKVTTGANVSVLATGNFT